MNEMNPTNTTFINSTEGDQITQEEDNNSNNCKLTNAKVDGNGNMSNLPLSDEENDGVLVMVSCKNFLLHNETTLENSTLINQDVNTANGNAEANSGEESNDDFEISTWSFSKEETVNETISKSDEETQENENCGANKRSAYYYDGIATPYRHRSEPSSEPIHMTLEEVKISLQRLYGTNNNNNVNNNIDVEAESSETRIAKKGAFMQMRRRNRKQNDDVMNDKQRNHQRKSFPSALKQTLRGWFKKGHSSSSVVHSKSSEELSSHPLTHDERGDEGNSNLLNTPSQSIPSLSPFANRALPPLPLGNEDNEIQIDVAEDSESENSIESSEPADFTSSIHKVKDYGWYWGPLSGEAAEKLLANEPDGSFIVRDSSDEHYIFSLTFKLNGLVRHVRIEHDQGNFSFGTFTNFRSHTIVGFIENAVEHSRSGRYLFFLHRRPLLGPMRVQLLHPVSRFKQVQSLQHMCRFVILKAVRRDLITQLPLPKRLKDYLNTAQYYTEDVDSSEKLEMNLMAPVVTPERHILLGDESDSLVTSIR